MAHRYQKSGAGQLQVNVIWKRIVDQSRRGTFSSYARQSGIVVLAHSRVVAGRDLAIGIGEVVARAERVRQITKTNRTRWLRVWLEVSRSVRPSPVQAVRRSLVRRSLGTMYDRSAGRQASATVIALSRVTVSLARWSFCEGTNYFRRRTPPRANREGVVDDAMGPNATGSVRTESRSMSASLREATESLTRRERRKRRHRVR